jgi:hypothetical protein
MKGYLRLTVHGAPAAAQGGSPPQATPVATCDMRLRVELTPDVSNPGDAEFILAPVKRCIYRGRIVYLVPRP